MAQISANGIWIEVETHGAVHDAPIVLIRGLGSQLIQWPPQMIEAFVAAGYFVVTFDNRDCGLSQKFDGHQYTLGDMADDTIGVMDALGLSKAHVLGMSMGGMILQVMALNHAKRLKSATIVMSSSRAPGLPEANAAVRTALVSKAPSAQREDVIAHALETGRLWQSPGWPFDAGERANMIGRCWDRSYCPDGVSRQFRAIELGTSQLSRIEEMETPTLVVHGLQDALLLPEHGRDIARRAPNARLIEIDGMGHDLEGAVPGMLSELAIDFIKSVDGLEKPLKD